MDGVSVAQTTERVEGPGAVYLFSLSLLPLCDELGCVSSLIFVVEVIYSRFKFVCSLADVFSVQLEVPIHARVLDPPLFR